MRALVVVVAVFALVLSGIGSVEAQRGRRGRARAGQVRDGGARSSGAEYRALIRDAVSEFAAGRWAEARALFHRAHELSPSARTLRGIGMCSFELRDYVGAIAELRASLDDRRRRLTAGQRRQVEALIGRAEAFVGRWSIALSPAGATVRVDGERAELEGGELALGMGSHVLRFEGAGLVAQERRIEVVGGERGDLEVRLVAAPVAAALAAPTEPVQSEGAAPIDLGAAPAALLIGGGALAVIGIGSAIWLADRESELGVCDAAGVDCLNRDTLATQRDASLGLVTGAFVGAALLAGTGALLLVVTSGSGSGERRAPRDEVESAHVSCAPAGLGVACSGTM